jgi:quercetin dioxygenase-like cupin family protein
MFLIILATLMVPIQVTSVSLYMLVSRLGWVDARCASTHYHKEMRMDSYMIDTTEVPYSKTDWGSVKNVFDAKAMSSTSGFSLGQIIYGAPHFSGRHEDNEVIQVLEGEGVATIDTQKIAFRPGCLLLIPAGIPHGITEVTRGPVTCLVIHFG